MRESDGTRKGTANSHRTLTGSGGNDGATGGTTKLAEAAGDTQVAQCAERLNALLIDHGVPPRKAASVMARVVRLALQTRRPATAHDTALGIALRALSEASA